MPTKNIKDVRGYMDVAYLFIDEADHFDKSIQELEPAIMAYEEKEGKTIMVSTPNAPGGLFERIEKDPNSKYKKLFLGNQYGLDRIYDRAFIEKKKLEPDFAREYDLIYLGRIGNIFSPLQIDKVIQLGEQYKGLPTNDYTLHSVGVDVGFGSSSTAVVLTEFLRKNLRLEFCTQKSLNMLTLRTLSTYALTSIENTEYMVLCRRQQQTVCEFNEGCIWRIIEVGE